MLCLQEQSRLHIQTGMKAAIEMFIPRIGTHLSEEQAALEEMRTKEEEFQAQTSDAEIEREEHEGIAIPESLTPEKGDDDEAERTQSSGGRMKRFWEKPFARTPRERHRAARQGRSYGYHTAVNPYRYRKGRARLLYGTATILRHFGIFPGDVFCLIFFKNSAL
ncbi:hypothetical protein BDQ12DRAFT_669604 [Crucibulum laeve]|uniref:Uncharacterized protein n=1 Tax=Crucibulum laeve TaxID=68775 RepID=A0A5C3LPB6_9AGAR|nr:hypothetical protein BDQ12DRAFT_669604 [Crucibulum laeve]